MNFAKITLVKTFNFSCKTAFVSTCIFIKIRIKTTVFWKLSGQVKWYSLSVYLQLQYKIIICSKTEIINKSGNSGLSKNRHQDYPTLTFITNLICRSDAVASNLLFCNSKWFFWRDRSSSCCLSLEISLSYIFLRFFISCSMESTDYKTGWIGKKIFLFCGANNYQAQLSLVGLMIIRTTKYKCFFFLPIQPDLLANLIMKIGQSSYFLVCQTTEKSYDLLMWADNSLLVSSRYQLYPKPWRDVLECFFSH